MSEPVPSKPSPRLLPKPPTLTTIYSMTSGMPAETFFALLKREGITVVADIRVNRSYSRAFWTHERDIGYICGLHNVEYTTLEDLMPTVELRQRLHNVIDTSKDRMTCAEAWTQYLEGFNALLTQRKILDRDRPVNRLIYGSHHAVAMICNCQHHRDCHRSVATAMVARWIEGVKVVELYPDGKPPARDANKVLIRDVSVVLKDDDKRIARLLKGRA